VNEWPGGERVQKVVEAGAEPEWMDDGSTDLLFDGLG
jgi:hypothetical protein